MKKVRLFCFLRRLSLLTIISMGCLNIYAQDLIPGAWPHLKGYWKFQNVNNLTKATVGNNLVLIGKHQYTAGPSVGDTAIRIAIGSYYDCRHNMAPNGGGDSVNRYTLMFDFKVLSFNKWHTFFKTDSNNDNDGECFIRPLTGIGPGRIGVAATGYSKDSINPNQWYRLMISVNLNNFYRYYLNGKLLHEGDTQEVDGRFALTPKMIFFGDDNQEDDTIDVASLAVFDTCLSASDIAKIGSIDPCIANPPKISLGRDTSLCDYNSIVKNAGAGFKKYQWSTGNTQASVTITKSIGIGKRNIWCRITDVNGCTAVDTFVLTYLTSPIVNLGPNQAFCKGVSSKLIAGTDTSYQYIWKHLPNGNTLSMKNSITIDSAGKYAVSVTSKAGCETKDTIDVMVYQNPPKPTVTITGKTILCKGETVILDGPGGYFDYLWSNGSNQQAIVVNKDAILTLKVLDNNNCFSPSSDSVIVKVYALPLSPKLALTGNTSFCSGDSVVITAPSGYLQYLWQDGPGNAIRVSKNAGLFYVVVKDTNDCASPNSDTIKLTLNPKPSKPSVAMVGKNDICIGETTILSAPAGFQSYSWSNGRKTRHDTIATSGNYRVMTENTFGCKSVWSDSVSVIVHPIPAKSIVVKMGKDSLKSSIINNQYKWFRNSVLLPDTNLAISAEPVNYYQVQVGNSFCWSPMSDSFFYIFSWIAKLNGHPSGLLIYPNPTQDEVIVRLKGLMQPTDAVVVITDMLGNEVYRQNTETSFLRTGAVVNLQGFPSGFYQLRIIISSETLVRKIEKL